MAVLITDRMIGIRRRATVYDAHGFPIPGATEDVTPLYPGLARERGGDGGWTLSVDEALWPIREDDVLFDDRGIEWLAITADHLRNEIDNLVNYIRVDARQRQSGGTEPGGPEFVGR
jgi:hypothetical protein